MFDRQLLKLIGTFHSSMNSSPHTKPLHLLHKPFTFPSTWGPFTTHPILLLILTKPSSSRRGQITHILEADQEMHLCVFSDFLVRELKDWDFENNPWVWVEMTWNDGGKGLMFFFFTRLFFFLMMVLTKSTLAPGKTQSQMERNRQKSYTGGVSLSDVCFNLSSAALDGWQHLFNIKIHCRIHLLCFLDS